MREAMVIRPLHESLASGRRIAKITVPSVNTCPKNLRRVVFLVSSKAKRRSVPALARSIMSNRSKHSNPRGAR
jgi:hypothetical protein